MRRLCCFLLLLANFQLKAQFSSDYPAGNHIIQAGAGYTHDFPGLNGYHVGLEYSKPMNEKLEASIGMKYMNISGYPRTVSREEFTKAKSFDLGIHFIPLQSESSRLSLGLGYSFVFYEVQRAYPVWLNGASDKSPEWHSQYLKGRNSGINLFAEYDYRFIGSGIFIGVRAAWYKSYDRVTAIGPVLGCVF
ncbi:MAG TPA: hypothetical protein VFS31_08055 [Chitinophagaceae bacterium]|nr:hypothetical protein [Chitinophagaceae bacterium]